MAMVVGGKPPFWTVRPPSLPSIASATLRRGGEAYGEREQTPVGATSRVPEPLDTR
jgi:hypothetical protein